MFPLPIPTTANTLTLTHSKLGYPPARLHCTHLFFFFRVKIFVSTRDSCPYWNFWPIQYFSIHPFRNRTLDHWHFLAPTLAVPHTWPTQSSAFTSTSTPSPSNIQAKFFFSPQLANPGTSCPIDIPVILWRSVAPHLANPGTVDLGLVSYAEPNQSFWWILSVHTQPIFWLNFEQTQPTLPDQLYPTTHTQPTLPNQPYPTNWCVCNIVLKQISVHFYSVKREESHPFNFASSNPGLGEKEERIDWHLRVMGHYKTNKWACMWLLTPPLGYSSPTQ